MDEYRDRRKQRVRTQTSLLRQGNVRGASFESSQKAEDHLDVIDVRNVGVIDRFDGDAIESDETHGERAIDTIANAGERFFKHD